MNKRSNQLRSKKRVNDHGEVFTSEQEVNAMLDLVKHETENIESRFLEPACGNGNFLSEVLRRKMEIVTYRYKKSQTEWERYALIALTSVYGIDILSDNVNECRDRLLKQFMVEYKSHYKSKCKESFPKAAYFILKQNILLGNALTLKTKEGDPLIFSEWSSVSRGFVKRRDFKMEELLNKEADLFSDLGLGVFIPQPVAEYPLIHILKLMEYDTTNLQS
ncbi:DNA methyltransferase [Clostridium sp.]|uniref:DNA methyltransferase n=1 Tax=Clostridium sp. TaxID=1506 RepID=UPI00283B2219|nr:DNA methyltransferase [Clostridium sp.]MDR3596646.1 hypothetical protein [Clostridium sp.]MDR3668889.1 hypothetical protein [Ignavibacteriaceae bacterium]